MNNDTKQPEPNSPAVDTKSIKFSTVNTRASRHTLGSESHDRNTTEEKIDREKESKTSNPLIKQLSEAVDAGDIDEEFTAYSVAKWMTTCDIRKGDSSVYKNFKAGSFLCSSYIGKKNKTNRNIICMDRRKNKDGIYQYWFID